MEDSSRAWEGREGQEGQRRVVELGVRRRGSLVGGASRTLGGLTCKVTLGRLAGWYLRDKDGEKDKHGLIR